VECYPNCGCEPHPCRLGCPPEMSPAPFAEEEEPENDRFRLQEWRRLQSNIIVTEPLVVLTELYPEPLVVIPRSPWNEISLQSCILMMLEDWIWYGSPSYCADLPFHLRQYIHTGGARKLTRVVSWYTSAMPMVYDAASRHEGFRARRALSLETIARLADRGWVGFPHRWNENSPPERIRLSWWRMYLARLRYRGEATLQSRLWAPISAWMPWWKSSGFIGIARFSPWIATQRQKLLDLYDDTVF
jgi:hypothetical protein